MECQLGGVYANEGGEKSVSLIMPDGEIVHTPLTANLAEELGLSPYILLGKKTVTDDKPTVKRLCRSNEGASTSAAADAADKEGSSVEKKNKKVWSHNETRLLLSLYKNHRKGFNGTSQRNSDLWKLIANEMKLNGFPDSDYQCKFKFNSLKRTYHMVKDNNSRSGAAHKTFEFYEDFETMLSKEPTVIPLAIAESDSFVVPQSTVDNFKELEEGDENLRPITKRKTTTSAAILEKLEKIAERKEERFRQRQEERRADRNEHRKQHDQLVSVLKESNELQKDFISKIISKF